MYTYSLLGIILAINALSQVITKEYDRREKSNPVLLSAVTGFGALIFFVLKVGKNFQFDIGILPYSIGFAVSYVSCLVAGLLAIHYGSFALSSLISSYSLIIPTLYGIIILHEKLSLVGIIGIAFLLISLYLITEKKERVKFSFLWIVSVAISFIGNGMCSTIQKMQQLKFSGAYKSEFMAIALLLAVIGMLCYGAVKKEIKRENIGGCLKYGLPKGLINGIVNLLVMVLTPLLPTAVLFPSISAGGIITAYLISTFIYKEKLSRIQKIGFIFGVCSIIFMNV